MENLVDLYDERFKIMRKLPKDWGQRYESFCMHLLEAWWDKEAPKREATVNETTKSPTNQAEEGPQVSHNKIVC